MDTNTSWKPYPGRYTTLDIKGITTQKYPWSQNTRNRRFQGMNTMLAETAQKWYQETEMKGLQKGRQEGIIIGEAREIQGELSGLTHSLRGMDAE